MELVPYSEEDIGLVEELECDPEAMRELVEPAAGTIGIWSAEWRGEPIYETGWMVLPAFQGQGIASRALAAGSFDFELIEETDFDYRGAQLRVNVWELAVGDPGLEPGTSSLSETRSNQLS
jgi:hypothetical protein